MSFLTETPPPLDVRVADVKIVSAAFGWLLGFTFLTAVKAGRQTLSIWRRLGRVTSYTLMVWSEIIACTTFGSVIWLCMNGSIRESFLFFLLGTTLRCIITQLIVQILANRISILVTSPRLKRILRWGPLTVVLILNIGVYCVWIPAHLRGTGPFFIANKYYSRCEKVIYMILDAALNYYFCSLVKSRLIDAGIGKYRSLYKFNLFIILLSMSLDILLIGLMSYPNPLVYVAFYPVIFMAKLNIEMTMADMIAKVARSSNGGKSRSYRLREDSLPTGDPETKDSASESINLKTDPTDRKAESISWTTDGAKPPGNDEPPCHNYFDRWQTPSNSLYHAWISGGMNSQTHLSREGIGQKRHSHSSGPGRSRLTSVDANTREGAGVITKNTIVDVKGEDMENASALMKGRVSG